MSIVYCQLYFKHQTMAKTLIAKQKKKVLGCLHLLEKLGLLLKFREVQKSSLTGKGRTGNFRSHCSQGREEPGSLEAISCYFLHTDSGLLQLEISSGTGIPLCSGLEVL